MDTGWRKEYARYKGFFLNIAEITQNRQDVKMFLEIILTLGTILIFTLLALKPTLLTIAGVVKEINSKEETIAKMEAKLADLNQAQILANENQESITLLDSAIPNSASPDTFARQVEGAASLTSTALTSLSIEEVTLKGESKRKVVSPDDKPLPGGAKSISANLNSEGAFTPIKDFLVYLENMRRPLRIDSIIISKKGVAEVITETVDSLSITITANAPYVEVNQKSEDDTDK